MTIDDLNKINPSYKNKLCLNQKQTAELLNVSDSTLENWRKAGIGPCYKKIENGKKGRVLYPKSAIIDWLNNTIKTA